MALKYKVGDRVRIKSLDWYNENKSGRGFICFVYANFIPEMSRYCGEILTISQVVEESKHYLVSECAFAWTDEMIEGLVEEKTYDFDRMYMESEKRYKEEYSKNEYCHEQSFKWGFQEGYDYAHEKEKLEINLKNGYEFKDENGNVINTKKIVLEKKSPKTDDIINWLREHDMTKYIGVIYSGMCSITFDTEKLIKDITEMIGDE